MTYRPRVYGASKLVYAPMWWRLRENPDWAFVDWTASWINKVDQEETSGPTDFAVHWEQDFRDIASSDFLLLFADEHNRGALVEAGYALACNLGVLTVGLPADHTWSYHPKVLRCDSLATARIALYKHTIMVPPASRRRKHDNEQA